MGKGKMIGVGRKAVVSSAVKKEQNIQQLPANLIRPKGTKGALSEEQKEFVKSSISDLYMKGYSGIAMEKWFELNSPLYISSVSIVRYTKEILQEWHNARVQDVDAAITAEMMKLQKIEQEAWSSWEKSKGIKTKKIRTSLPNGGVTESVEEVDSVGDAKYLDIIRGCISERLKRLDLGGSAEDFRNIQVQNNTVFIGVVDRKSPEDVQGKIQHAIEVRTQNSKVDESSQHNMVE